MLTIAFVAALIAQPQEPPSPTAPLRGVLAGFGAQDEDPRPKELRELDALRADVETLRVLDELKLTKEQREKLIAVLDAGRAKIDAAVKDSGDAIEKATKALREQRDAALKGETIPEERQREAGEAQRRLGEIYRTIEETGRSIMKEAKAVLDASQMEELSWVSRHDPAAQVRRWARQSLPRLREIPDEAFDEGGVEQIIQFVSRFPGIPEDAREDETVRIHDIIVEARKMSAEEFAKKSGDLVKKIVSEGKMGEIAKRMPRPPEGDGQLGRFLMQPRVMRLLKERK